LLLIMPVLPQGIGQSLGSKEDMKELLRGPERVQQSMTRIIDIYASDQRRGLVVPDSLARLDEEAHRFVATGPAKDDDGTL
jgi:hypothetical protein